MRLSTPGSPQSKITSAEAVGEAGRLLEDIQSADKNPETVGAALCTRYTASPRRKILQEMMIRIRQGRMDISHSSMLGFLKAQNQGVNSRFAVKHIAALLNAALVVATEVASDLLLELLALAGNGDSLYPGSVDLASVIVRLRPTEAVPDLLGQTLEKGLAEDRADYDFLMGWYRMLLMVLDPRSSQFSLDSSYAMAILALLRSVEAEQIPSDLLLTVPAVTTIAGQAAWTEHSGSELAELLSDFSIVQYAPSAPREMTQIRHQLLQCVYALFDDEDLRRREMRQETERYQEELQCARSDVARLITDHREEVESLRGEVDELRGVITKQKKHIQHITAQREELRHEIELQRVESESHLRHHIEQHEDTLRRKLLRPADTLRDLIIDALNEYEDGKVYLVALAFDDLHMRMLNVMNHPSASRLRIPRDMLQRPGEEDSGE